MENASSPKIEPTKDGVKIMTVIGWTLFGLLIVLIPLWIVFFVYFLLFIIVVSIFFLLREFFIRSKKSKAESSLGSAPDMAAPP
jgi:uncharacterized membrane protein